MIRSKMFRRVMVSVLVFPLIAISGYILSIGPVMFVWNAFELDDKGPVFETVLTLYSPLIKCEDKPFGKFLTWYMQKWATAGRALH